MEILSISLCSLHPILLFILFQFRYVFVHQFTFRLLFTQILLFIFQLIICLPQLFILLLIDLFCLTYLVHYILFHIRQLFQPFIIIEIIFLVFQNFSFQMTDTLHINTLHFLSLFFLIHLLFQFIPNLIIVLLNMINSSLIMNQILLQSLFIFYQLHSFLLHLFSSLLLFFSINPTFHDLQFNMFHFFLQLFFLIFFFIQQRILFIISLLYFDFVFFDFVQLFNTIQIAFINSIQFLLYFPVPLFILLQLFLNLHQILLHHFIVIFQIQLHILLFYNLLFLLIKFILKT